MELEHYDWNPVDYYNYVFLLHCPSSVLKQLMDADKLFTSG